MVQFHEDNSPLDTLGKLLQEGQVIGGATEIPIYHVNRMSSETEQRVAHRDLTNAVANELLKNEICRRAITRGDGFFPNPSNMRYEVRFAVMSEANFKAINNLVAQLQRERASDKTGEAI